MSPLASNFPNWEDSLESITFYVIITRFVLHVVNEHSSEAAGQQDNKEKMSKGGREGVIAAAAAPWDFVCALNNHPGMKLFVSPLLSLSSPPLPLLASNGCKHEECFFRRNNARTLVKNRICENRRMRICYYFRKLFSFFVWNLFAS